MDTKRNSACFPSTLCCWLLHLCQPTKRLPPSQSMPAFWSEIAGQLRCIEGQPLTSNGGSMRPTLITPFGSGQLASVCVGLEGVSLGEAMMMVLDLLFSEAQSWRKRSMTHRCSQERAPASAHASAHASVHQSAHESLLSLCYNPIQTLPLECSRECSRGCPRKCTRSGLVRCHLVCFNLLCSLPIVSFSGSRPVRKLWDRMSIQMS